MRITNPKSGKSFVQKRRVRYDEPGQARALTFSCYRRFQFHSRDRTRNWFVEALEEARKNGRSIFGPLVIMPEHVHLLVYPREPGLKVGSVRKGVPARSLPALRHRDGTARASEELKLS